MDGRARLIAAWCRQAKESGALTGDLAYVQLVALDLLHALENLRELNAFKNQMDLLDSKFMDWLAVEHREVYDKVQEQRQIKEDQESYIDISELQAEDMMQLIAKMRQREQQESMERGT